MRADLLAASEAEKSAVLATTDEGSRAFADQARASNAAVDRARQELAAVLERAGTDQQKRALAAFTAAFAELQRTDEVLLAQAEQNTNLKAYALTYGPATEAMNEMIAALDRLGAIAGEAPTGGTAARAEIGALRILTMLPPHIAEASDERMTEMEIHIASQVEMVRAALAELAARPEIAASADLRAATAAWERFMQLEPQILSLSRQNTNVRSLELSLAGKRAALAGAKDALAALEAAVAPAGVPAGRWVLPE
jgi:hypothetical protein